MTLSAGWTFLKHAARHPYALLPGAPSGIINSARDWVDDYRRKTPVDIRRGPPAAYWEIDPPTLQSLPAPHGIDTPTSGRALRIFPTPGTALFFFKGARVLGGDGVVLSPDNKVFAEFTYVDGAGGVDQQSIFRRRRFPPAAKLDGWYATLCYPSSRTYFHWIAETLPRIKLLQPHVESLDGIFVPSGLEPQLLDSLQVMGIRQDQLIPMEMASHFQPEHLLVPAYCAGLDVPQWVPTFLRSAVLGETVTVPKRRIYISRADAAKRRVLNEGDLLPLLKVLGFECVRLRDLDFQSQAAAFDQAEIVIGPHGAGLANVVFSRPGFKLLELLPSSNIGPHVYYSLTAAARGEYWFLAGSPAAKAALPEDEIHMDFTIDPIKLEAVLNRMGIKKSETRGEPKW